MTPMEEISKTLWHLHSQVITQVEAEKIIFPIISRLCSESRKRGRDEAGSGDDDFSMTSNYYHQD